MLHTGITVSAPRFGALNGRAWASLAGGRGAALTDTPRGAAPGGCALHARTHAEYDCRPAANQAKQARGAAAAWRRPPECGRDRMMSVGSPEWPGLPAPAASLIQVCQCDPPPPPLHAGRLWRRPAGLSLSLPRELTPRRDPAPPHPAPPRSLAVSPSLSLSPVASSGRGPCGAAVGGGVAGPPSGAWDNAGRRGRIAPPCAAFTTQLPGSEHRAMRNTQHAIGECECHAPRLARPGRALMGHPR